MDESQDGVFLQTLFAHAMARLGDADALQECLALLRHPDEDVRARQLPLVVLLYRKQGRDPHVLLLEGLGDRRAEVRSAALESAMQQPDERLLPTVAALLGDRSDGVRYLARRFVKAAECQDAALLAPVLGFLLDPERDVEDRIGTLQALAYPHEMEPVARALRQAVEDPHPAVRRWAGKVLTSYRDRANTAVHLLARLEDTVPREVELSLLWALARLADREGQSLLRAALQSGDPEVMAPAVYGLGLLEDPEDLPLLREVRGRTPVTA